MGMSTNLTTKQWLVFILSSIFIVIGISFIAFSHLINESVLLFDRGIAYLVIGLALITYLLAQITVVDTGRVMDQLEEIKKMINNDDKVSSGERPISSSEKLQSTSPSEQSDTSRF
jgi:cytochrome c biogenesis protein CcdA